MNAARDRRRLRRGIAAGRGRRDGDEKATTEAIERRISAGECSARLRRCLLSRIERMRHRRLAFSITAATVMGIAAFAAGPAQTPAQQPPARPPAPVIPAFGIGHRRDQRRRHRREHRPADSRRDRRHRDSGAQRRRTGAPADDRLARPIRLHRLAGVGWLHPVRSQAGL